MQPRVALLRNSSSAQIDNRDEFRDRLAMIAYFRCQYDYPSTWFIYCIHQHVGIADCSSCGCATPQRCAAAQETPSLRLTPEAGNDLPLKDNRDVGVPTNVLVLTSSRSRVNIRNLSLLLSICFENLFFLLTLDLHELFYPAKDWPFDDSSG